MRKFEVVSTYKNRNIILPTRSTECSAGYDIRAAETVKLEPGTYTIIHTGVKAYMEPDDVLLIYIRSSMAFKKHLMLANCVGVIDSDYVDNPDNEGEILIGIMNFDDKPVIIGKDDKIAQGIFVKYLKVEGDIVNYKRTGGVGSTGGK